MAVKATSPPPPPPWGQGRCRGPPLWVDAGRESVWGICLGPGLTRGLDGHPHLIGTHAAGLVQVKLPEDGLEQGAEGEGQAEGGTLPFQSTPGWGGC